MSRNPAPATFVWSIDPAALGIWLRGILAYTNATCITADDRVVVIGSCAGGRAMERKFNDVSFAPVERVVIWRRV